MKLQAGDIVRAYGHHWEVLDPEYEGKDGTGVLCLSKNIIKKMAFSEKRSNDYAESDVKKWLEEEFTPKLLMLGAKFKTVCLNPMADNGSGWDREPIVVKGAFLLTDDLYRKYYRYISSKNDWWWTATAYSFNPDSLHGVRYVNTNGSFGSSNERYYHIGVVPACVFSFSSLSQQDITIMQEIETLKKEIEKLEKQLNMRYEFLTFKENK